MATYVPRTTAPTGNEKWWRTVSSGGVNPCINISNGSVLPNCFSGDTKIKTPDGDFPLWKLAGRRTQVLTIDGLWRDAIVHYFGEQELWAVNLSNGHTYRASANHRWLVYDVDGISYNIVTTDSLKPGMFIHNTETVDGCKVVTTVKSVECLHRIDSVYCPVEPITHTCTLDGGELTGQCVGYAWGRFSEIIGSPCSLPTANAGDWWELVRGYDKGQTPKLGSVIVWGKSGQPGHVAIVEKINSDGSILTSNSAYAGTRFYMQTVYPPSYTWGGGFYCKGFIYNPAVSGSATVSTRSTTSAANPVSEFLNEAMKHVGEDGTWTYKKSGLSSGVAWCAAFVVAVGLQVGNIINKVIYNSFSVSTMVSEGVSKGYGTFTKSAFFGSAATPSPGDLVVFRWNSKSAYQNKNEYYGDHIAIVREVKNGNVYTVEGNCNNKVACNQYALSNTCISGYFRPRWSTIGGTSTSSSVTYSGIDIYDTQSTREDASMREVSYITPQGKPSISTANIRLSVINYTSSLAALVKLPSEVLDLAASTKVDTSRLSMRNAKNICDYLLSKNFTAAQAVGIMANMRAESGLLPNAVNATSKASGLCQWYASRRTAMISHVGSNWANNLSGQLDYLWYELNSSEKVAYNALKAITELSEDAAVRCSDAFCKYFERPGNDTSVYAIRRTYAKEFWKQLSIVSTNLSTSPNGSGLLITQSGKELSRGTEIVIPTTFTQFGISDNSINYTYESPKWTSEKRKAIATLWQKANRPSNRNIATLGGYFICGATSKIGEVGDLLTVELFDATKFTALIGFSPLPLGQNMWGYEVEDGKTHILQWAKKGTSDNKLNNVIKIDTTGWSGKTIKRVVNYGTFLDEEG